MPIKGYRAAHCKHGHELIPDNRMALRPGERGGGQCRTCALERARRREGSPLAGTFLPDPAQVARDRAKRRGQKICPQCNQAKAIHAFNRDSSNSDSLHGWCRACKNFHKRGGYAAHRQRYLDAKRLQEFGVTPEMYQSMMDEQDGVCWICRRTCKTGRALAIDHDHKTGFVRGLLCAECNRGLGAFGDVDARLTRALLYLERSCNAQEEENSAGLR